MGRTLLLALSLAFTGLAAAPPVQSVEFPWSAYPRAQWERELVRIKGMGIVHVSLPPAHADQKDQLAEAVKIVRRLGLEADLEGAVPEALQQQMHAHGGPLTETPAAGVVRISALAPDALSHGRRLLTAATPMIVWTDVEDTMGAAGYHAGAINFSGQETPATTPLRRNAQLSKYWGSQLGTLHPVPGAGPKIPAPGVTAQQFAAEEGASFIQASNGTAKPWTGDLKATNPALKKVFYLANVTIPAHDSLWLPVNVPLMSGPLCKECTAFATVDRLLYSTIELTAMEYENGILAMEFSAPSAGEVALQISREPSGPLVAGGKPSEFDWDEATKRAKLPIPAGKGTDNRVRIGVAIEAPDATAFFDSARVLLIGETNNLVAQFSSDAIMQRSRLRAASELHVAQDAGPEPLKSIYRIGVPATVVHGDRTELAIEADGSRMSHANPQYLRPVELRFADAMGVRVGPNSTLPLFPSAVPVNQRTGRDVTISIQNNAPEIRNFHLELKAEGLDFSPAKLDVTVGVSTSRDVSFRVFTAGASAGVHTGEAHITGAAEGTEAVRFVVYPQSGAVAWSADGFTFLESARTRAAFIPGHWFEFLNKDNGQNALAAGGTPFTPGAIEAAGDAVTVAGEKTLRLADLEQLVPKPKR